MSFSRQNIFTADLKPESAHEGDGFVQAVRLATRASTEGACHFVDYAVIPPGCSVGDHQHADDEEEYYLVLDGTGQMRLDDEHFSVKAGDLVRNRPGGTHGLRNTGDVDLRLFVFEVDGART